MLKRNALALLLAALPFAACAADSYTVDPMHTYPHFSVSHMGFSTMHGRFDETSGKITLDTKAKRGSMEITIKTGSITTGYAKRDNHLKSPDFFNAAEFPVMTFKSTKMKFKGDVPVSVEGELTLLGVTKPVTLTITEFKCGANPMNKKYECGAGATGKIKRSDFGMNKFPIIGDEIKLVFEIEAYKD